MPCRSYPPALSLRWSLTASHAQISVILVLLIEPVLVLVLHAKLFVAVRKLVGVTIPTAVPVRRVASLRANLVVLQPRPGSAGSNP